MSDRSPWHKPARTRVSGRSVLARFEQQRGTGSDVPPQERARCASPSLGEAQGSSARLAASVSALDEQ